jgi:hypothetical protein
MFASHVVYETFDAYIAETNKRKGEVAQGIAEEHAAQH